MLPVGYLISMICYVTIESCELTQVYMISFAIVVCLIVECFFFFTMVMSMSNSIGDGAYHLSVSAIFHP